MTTANARFAGVKETCLRRSRSCQCAVVFLLYMATGIAIMIPSAQATGAGGIAARLTAIAAHPLHVRQTIVLDLLTIMCANPHFGSRINARTGACAAHLNKGSRDTFRRWRVRPR